MDNTLDPDSPLLGQLLWSADPATQNAISLVLVAAAVAVCFVYAPLVVRLVRLYLLDRAVREACRLDDRSAEAHREELARAFARSPVESQWEAFVDRWRASLAGGDRERAPVRLIDVFDERPVVPTGAIKSLLPALPGLFLAVGVLGSFVGLAGAIGLGGAAVDGTATAALVGERVGLALGSALWGLILSIAAAVGGRMLEGAFDRLAESIDHEVERAFGAVSGGELSSLSARAQRDALAELGIELKRFASDLTERLDRGLQRIEQSTAQAASLVSEQQRNALKNVVAELSLQVQTGVEQHLAALHDVLDRAVDHQGAVTGGLAEAFEQMSENAEAHARVTQSLEQSALSVREAATSMSGTAHDLSPVLEHLRATGSTLAETAATMNATQDVVAHSAEGIRGSIDHATAALFEQRQFIETGLEEIRATLELMSTGLGENLNHALRNVDDALEHTVGRLRETLEHSNETIDRLASPVRAAEGTTREMQTALERVRDEVLALGEWMGQAVRPLKSNLAQIEDRAGDVTRALVQFGDHAVHVDKTMDALRSEIHEEGRRFRSSTSELTRHLQMAVDAAGRLRGAPPSTDPPTPPAPTPTPPRRAPAPRPAPPRSATAPVSAPASAPLARAAGATVAAGAEPDIDPGIEPGIDAGTDPEIDVDIEVDDDWGREDRPDDLEADEPGGPVPPTAAAAGAGTGTGGVTGAGDPRRPGDDARGATPLPVRVHPAPRREPAPTPRPPTSRAAAPAPAPRAEPDAGAPTPRVLGPDPYARVGDAGDALERQRRLLESDRSRPRLEVDEDPSGPAAEQDELTLSGLLKSPGRSGSTRPRGARTRAAADVARAGAPDASDPEAAAADGERPRTWQLLGKD